MKEQINVEELSGLTPNKQQILLYILGGIIFIAIAFVFPENRIMLFLGIAWLVGGSVQLTHYTKIKKLTKQAVNLQTESSLRDQINPEAIKIIMPNIVFLIISGLLGVAFAIGGFSSIFDNNVIRNIFIFSSLGIIVITITEIRFYFRIKILIK
jgi:hypothetical protein